MSRVSRGLMVFLQLVALYVIRACGGFALALHLTRQRLRVLCYHGFSVGDEHRYAPVMFLRPATFERRLRILKKRRIPVIPLDEAVRRFEERNITSAETVITLDDGWTSNLTIALPILEKYGFPACVYVTTEHLAAGTEAFNVALGYMVWRSPRSVLQLAGIHPELDGVYEIKKAPEKSVAALIKAAEGAFPLPERQQLLPSLATALEVPLEEVFGQCRFRFLDRSEVQKMHRRGIDIQLHSHTHHLPPHDFAAAASEIESNRKALKELLGTEPAHFCYPSGRYAEHHPQWLRTLGIRSGTTCDPGHNKPGASVMLLKRYLDSDRTRDIVFEAEICGVRDIARDVLSALERLIPNRSRESGHVARRASGSKL